MKLGLLALLISLAGCGASLGDACSSDVDCGRRACSLASSFPGGYCTQRCTLGDDSTCPPDSTCLSHHDDAVCLRGCADDVECRDGYTCHLFRGRGPFCLDPGDD